MRGAINNKKKLLETCKKNDIVFLAIFGSFVNRSLYQPVFKRQD